jgi:uncharacterized protein (DUF2249 family)
MKISEDTKISELIKFNPKAIELIASINPHFEKLRNPVLRKILASRVTIKDAAKIGKCSTSIFFEKLASIGCTLQPDSTIAAEKKVSSVFSLDHDKPTVTMDVRPDIDSGKDPFLKIISAIDGLNSGECLLLINSFEPVPLISILRENNYECYIKQENETVSTLIQKNKDSKPFQSKKPIRSNFKDQLDYFRNRTVLLDVRLLEVPGPMIRILNELESLPDNYALHVSHRRVPQLLLPELESRGFSILIKDNNDGCVELLIYKQCKQN